MLRPFRKALKVLLFLALLLPAGTAISADDACTQTVCKERRGKRHPHQEWGFGVSHSWHCSYWPTGDCPYLSYGIFGFGRLEFGKRYAFLLSGGAMASRPFRWKDADGAKHTKTLIDLHLNIDYRIDVASFNGGSVASSIELSAGGGLGLRLRVYLKSTSLKLGDLQTNVPDITGALQPYLHLFVLVSFSHAFVMLTADLRDDATVSAAFGLGF